MGSEAHEPQGDAVEITGSGDSPDTDAAPGPELTGPERPPGLADDGAAPDDSASPGPAADDDVDALDTPDADPERYGLVTNTPADESTLPVGDGSDRGDGLSDLVAEAKAGDARAFEELVRRTHAGALTLAVRLMGNEEDAHDVVQDAYVRAYRGLRRFRGDARFSTWLYRIVANCCATSLGKRNRNRHEELTDDAPFADDHPDRDPELAAAGALERERVSAAVAALPERLRLVVVLRDVYDLPHEAIAAELGISETAAKVRLHRARKKLRARLYPLRDEAGTEYDELDEDRDAS